MPGLLSCIRFNGNRQKKHQRSTAARTRFTFVARSARTRAGVPSFLNRGNKKEAGTPGSLDLGYQFPPKEVPITQHLHFEFDPSFDTESVTRFYEDSDYQDEPRESLDTFELAAEGRLSVDYDGTTINDENQQESFRDVDVEYEERGSMDTALAHFGTYFSTI